MIQILHDHGYCVSYNEVLQFRKLAAKYVTDNDMTLHQIMGLSRIVGLVFGWYDNSDFSVSTPNGRRDTHAMATEFQVHPAGIIQPGNAQLPGLNTLVISRFNAKQYKSLDDTRAIPIMHYTGQRKVSSTAVETSNISYTDLCA